MRAKRNRGIVLGTLLATGTLSLTIAAFQQPPAAAGQAAPKVVEVNKLKDNLYMLTGMGGGGNTAVFVTSTGVVVVDTKNPGWGQPLIEKIRTLTDKPVTTIINTHTHGDHVSGNVEFPASVEVVTHENTKANMEKMATPTGITPQPGTPANIFKDHKGHGLPRRTFKDRLTLGKGSDQVDLYYFGRGHTNGDAWVVFPSLRMAHAGDIFSGKNLPLLDTVNGGSGVEIGNTLAKAASTLSNVDGFISGHSTVMTMGDLKEYADFNRDFLAAVQEAKRTGRTIDEVANTWKIPAKYTGYAAPAAARLRSNIEVVFNELR